MTQIRTETRSGLNWWSPRWWNSDGRWLALGAPLVLYAGHVSYGAMLPKTSLTLSFAGSLLLLTCLLAPQLRKELARVRSLTIPGALFALTLAVGLWSLTPFVPGGPHPVWQYGGLSSAASTIDRSQTVLELIKLTGLAAFFVIGLAAGASDGRARLTIQVTVLIGAALALASFLDFAGGALGPGNRRLGFTFEAANTAATLFAVLLMLALGAALSRSRAAAAGKRFTAAAPFGGSALILAVCLLATASRGGFTATAVGLIVLAAIQLLHGKVKWTRAIIIGVIFLGASAALLALAGDVLIGRLLGLGAEIDTRHAVLVAHWDAFRGARWMGYGLGTFDIVNRLMITSENIQAIWTYRAAHNVYLSWLEQAGILGAAPLFACIGTLIWLTLRGALRRSRLTLILFCLLAADAVVMAHGATDFALETYSMAAFWTFLLGLQFSAAQGSATR